VVPQQQLAEDLDSVARQPGKPKKFARIETGAPEEGGERNITFRGKMKPHHFPMRKRAGPHGHVCRLPRPDFSPMTVWKPEKTKQQRQT
jgi:hypothetical protein